MIEFKLGTTAVSAIRRIKAKHYADRFAGNGKTLTLIGLAFSKAKRILVAAKIEEVRQRGLVDEIDESIASPHFIKCGKGGSSRGSALVRDAIAHTL